MSIISSPKDDHKAAVAVRDNRIWEKLRGTTILSAVNAYLSSLRNDHTRNNYRAAFKIFFEMGLLNPNQNLQFLSLANVDSIGDNIRRKVVGCEGTKQARVAAFIVCVSAQSVYGRGLKSGKHNTLFEGEERG